MRPAPVMAEGFARRSPAPKWSRNVPTAKALYSLPLMQIAAGVPLVTVAGRAGHARTSTTTDIYNHFLKSSDKTAAEKLEQLFE